MVSPSPSAWISADRRPYEMIGRNGAHLHRQRGSTKAGKLVGMYLQLVALRARRLENTPCLCQIECAILAKHVAKERDAMTFHPASAGGQHLLNHQIDVTLAITLILCGDRVRRQKCIAEFDRLLFLQSVHHVKLFDLALCFQAIPCLSLSAGGAIHEHALQPGQIGSNKLLDSSRAGGAHSRHNATASRHNLHVRCSPKALFKLVGAVAHPRQVRVGINKTRDNTPSSGIQHGAGVISCAQLRAGTDGHNPPILHRDGAVGDEAQVA
jgi:hypothetical protein